MSAFSLVVNAGSARCEFLLSGEIDLSVTEHLTDIVLDCAKETDATEIVMNLRAVRFIDSTGLGALVAIRKAVEPLGKQLRLVNVSARVADLLAITGLDHVFTISTDSA